MNTTLPTLPARPKPWSWTWSALERQAIKTYGEMCARAALAEAAQSLPDEAGLCDPSCGTYDLASMILSDCGHSTNNQRLLDRVAARIDKRLAAVLAASPAQPVQPSATAPLLERIAELERSLEFAQAVAAADNTLHHAIDAAQAKVAELEAERDSLREVNAELLEALEAIKSNLMHQRRFGVDDMGSWKRAATGAEADIEDAISSAASARNQENTK